MKSGPGPAGPEASGLGSRPGASGPAGPGPDLKKARPGRGAVQKTGKKLAGRPAGFGQNEKPEEEPKVRQNKSVVLGVCSKTRFLTKIENCKNCIGNSFDAIYTKPRFHRHWLLKLFCIRKSFMRDVVV